MKRRLFFIFTFLLFAEIAHAGDNLTLTGAVFQEMEIKNADGKIERKMMQAETVVPGTEVVYVITYQNKGAKPAEKVVITNPVPKELEYIMVMPSVAKFDVSVDEGKKYDDLQRLNIKDSDGKRRPARATDVTHLRWAIPSDVAPGKTGAVSFRARLK